MQRSLLAEAVVKFLSGYLSYAASRHDLTCFAIRKFDNVILIYYTLAASIARPPIVAFLFCIHETAMRPLNTLIVESACTIANEIQRLNVENLYFIGTVSAPPRVFVVSDRLRNAPREDGIWGARVMTPYLTEQFFIAE